MPRKFGVSSMSQYIFLYELACPLAFFKFFFVTKMLNLLTKPGFMEGAAAAIGWLEITGALVDGPNETGFT